MSELQYIYSNIASNSFTMRIEVGNVKISYVLQNPNYLCYVRKCFQAFFENFDN